MSDARTTTITDTDRVEWLLRYGSAIQADGVTIQSRDQVDDQIRKSRRHSDAAATGEALEGTRESETPKPMHGLAHGTLFSRTAELSMISAANRELAMIIGDLRLRRCS